MDMENKLVVLGIVGGLCSVLVVLVALYMRQGKRQHERDANTMQMIGLVLWCLGLYWLCEMDEIPAWISVSLIATGLGMHWHGIKIELVRLLREADGAKSES
jgi:steroid 5-alpha reductase family enzyme